MVAKTQERVFSIMDIVADEVRASLTSHPLVIHGRWSIPLPAAPSWETFNLKLHTFHLALT